VQGLPGAICRSAVRAPETAGELRRWAPGPGVGRAGATRVCGCSAPLFLPRLLPAMCLSPGQETTAPGQGSPPLTWEDQGRQWHRLLLIPAKRAVNAVLCPGQQRRAGPAASWPRRPPDGSEQPRSLARGSRSQQPGAGQPRVLPWLCLPPPSPREWLGPCRAHRELSRLTDRAKYIPGFNSWDFQPISAGSKWKKRSGRLQPVRQCGWNRPGLSFLLHFGIDKLSVFLWGRSVRSRGW